MFKEKDILFMMEKLNLNRSEAIELLKFDIEAEKPTEEERVEREEEKRKKREKREKQGIQLDDLEFLKKVISSEFKNEPFKNKDLHLRVSDRFSIRQTPSRLKKLVNENFLEDLGGQPKSYKKKIKTAKS